jgi:hypothetical protein
MLYTRRSTYRTYGYKFWQWLALGLGLFWTIGLAL